MKTLIIPLFCLCWCVSTSFAADVDASATFRSALSANIIDNMSFGEITYSNSTIENITLLTDGTMQYGADTDGAATATPGVAGDNGSSIAVSCSASATLANAGHAIDLSTIQISVAGNTDVTCLGLGNTAATYSLTDNG